MSRTDALVIAVTMGMFGIVIAVLVASLIWRDKARILWSTTGFVLFGGLCSWLFTLGIFAALIQNKLALLLICLMPAAGLIMLAVILKKTSLYGTGGKTLLMVVIVLVGIVAGYGGSKSIRNAYGVRQMFSPLVQKEFSPSQGMLQPQPWFVLYNQDTGEFDLSRAGMYSRYTTDPDCINTIVLYKKSTSHVGQWVDTHGTKVAEGIRETIHVIVVDAAGWSVVERQDFEAKGEPTKDGRKGVYTQKISITDNAIRDYLDSLLAPSNAT